MPRSLYRSAGLLLIPLGGLLLALARPGLGCLETAAPPPAPGGPTFIDQDTHDPRLKGFRTPDGFKLEIVAEDPVVVNPVALAFAEDGTPHVLEWRPSSGEEGRGVAETVKYRDGSTRKVTLPTKKVKDVVKTLTSSKGAFDKGTLVLEDELPSSILLHDGWLYLTGRGSVRRFKQSKPGAPYDTREVLVQGIGGQGQQPVAGLTLGPDGWLYLSAGAGDHFVEGSDGSRATVLRTGAVFRCKPDGSRLHTFATGLKNPNRDGAFDVAGNLFLTDSDPEESKDASGRLLHVAESGDHGWRLAWGERGWRRDPVRAVSAEGVGRTPALHATLPGLSAGVLIYKDARLPEPYRGLVFSPDGAHRSIRAYRVEPTASTFQRTEQVDLLLGPKTDPFRPCQVVTGPDGALYIVDRRTRGKEWGEGKGRIYRLSWSGTREEPALPLRGVDSWARVCKSGDRELLETLSSEEGSLRDQARLELVRRGEKNRKALLDLLRNDEKPDVARLAALGALGSMWDAEVQKGFLRVLVEGGAELRRLAAEGLGLNATRGDPNAHNALLKALSDDDLAVRRAVALAMGRVAGAGTADNLASTLSFEEGKDPHLRDGLVRALESLGAPGIKALVGLADSGVQKDTDRVVEAFLSLRSREAFATLPEVLRNPHVSDAQRAALVRSASNYLLDPPVNLDPIVQYLIEHPEEPTAIKKAGLELLATPGLVTGARARTWVQGFLDDKALQGEAARVLAELKKRE